LLVFDGVRSSYSSVLNRLIKRRLFGMGNQVVNILFVTEEDDSRLQTKVKRAPEQGKTPPNAGSH
jgi:hypothetical protein